MMELSGFGELVADASVVVVGEGALDTQTLGGKAPYRVAERAKPMVLRSSRSLVTTSIHRRSWTQAHSIASTRSPTSSRIATFACSTRIGCSIKLPSGSSRLSSSITIALH